MLVGTGPLPLHRPKELGFPQIRTRQFLVPLLEAGHDVLLAAFVRGAEAARAEPGRTVDLMVPTPSGSRTCRSARVPADEPGRFLMLRDLRGQFAPDAVITAGPFLPMGGGARAVADEPLWIDVPGDPMAEAQAKAAASGSWEPVARYRELYAQALLRGDRFSTISGPQRQSLLGALGLAGRLTGDLLGHDPVAVVPGSVDGIREDDGRDPVPFAAESGARIAALVGGYNNWLDGDTLIEGLLRAMDAEPALIAVSTGGALTDHDEHSYSRFRAAADRSRHAARFRFLGWVDFPVFDGLLARADVLVYADRDCAEAELGARTRTLDAARHAVPIAGTALSAETRALRDDGVLFDAAPGDAEALAAAIGAALRGRPAAERFDAARHRHGSVATAAPLLDWAAEPRRAPQGAPVDFLDDAWQELARLQDRLESVWRSPTWRTLGPLHRLWSTLRR
jgi:glycosyltransferase involved in cell wall biosynthesis